VPELPEFAPKRIPAVVQFPPKEIPAVFLASRSPQRRAILEQLGIPFEVRVADVQEREGGPVEEVVSENALRKARAIAAHEPSALVMGVDTVVELGGSLYGKPSDRAQAAEFLRALSGRRHRVWSGLVLIEDGQERTGVATTDVAFRPVDPGLAEWYLASGEWRERAGGYAIQGKGAALVERIDGDYWNVVGLPVALLVDIAPGLMRGLMH
jgi:septum formation protein